MPALIREYLKGAIDLEVIGSFSSDDENDGCVDRSDDSQSVADRRLPGGPDRSFGGSGRLIDLPDYVE